MTEGKAEMGGVRNGGGEREVGAEVGGEGGRVCGGGDVLTPE